MLIKSSRAHSARHEFISHSYSLPCHHHRQEETRTLIRDSLSLSLCVHSLSLSVFLLLLLFVFTFHPQKWALDTKIKTLFPPLSLSFLDESIRSSSAQMYICYNCVIKGLHEYFIRVEKGSFLSSSPRVVSSSSIRERERERERERKRKKEKSAQKRRRRKFCIYKIRETWKKNKSLRLLFCRHSRERERDRLRNTLHNHAVFCHTSTTLC